MSTIDLDQPAVRCRVARTLILQYIAADDAIDKATDHCSRQEAIDKRARAVEAMRAIRDDLRRDNAVELRTCLSSSSGDGDMP